MKRRKRLCGLLTGALGAVLALALAGTALAATDPGVQVVSATADITVHVYDGTPSSSSGDGTEIDDTSNPGNPVEDAVIGYYKVGEVVQYTDSATDTTSLMYAVSDEAAQKFGWGPTGTSVTIGVNQYTLVDGEALSGLLTGKTSSELKGTDASIWKTSGPTEGDGSTTISPASGLYLLIGYSMPANVTTEIVPFFVSAPMPDANSSGQWLTTIHVYPKVQTADAITIKKTVDSKDSESVNSNTDLSYEIKVTIPEDAQNLAKFEIKDDIPTGLTLTQGSAAVTSSGVVLGEGDYTISSPNGKVLFSLTSNGLAKFNGNAAQDTTITIKYTAQLSEGANLADAITNTATLTYQYTGGIEATADDSATVYAYGIDLTKTFAGTVPTAISDTKFELYKDNSGTLGDKVNIDGSNGVYWVDPDGSAELAVTAATDGSGSGTLTVNGLAAGTYYLKETAAPSGYSVLKDPITIVVSAGTSGVLEANIKKPTATVNGVVATINPRTDAPGEKVGLVRLTVENQPENFFTGLLPNTGDVGSVVATIVGLGLVCVAVVLVVNGRRKGGRAES